MILDNISDLSHLVILDVYSFRDLIRDRIGRFVRKSLLLEMTPVARRL